MGVCTVLLQKRVFLLIASIFKKSEENLSAYLSEFTVSARNMRPIIPVAFTSPRTPTLIQCSGT
jgi:hypothetical protein